MFLTKSQFKFSSLKRVHVPSSSYFVKSATTQTSSCQQCYDSNFSGDRSNLVRNTVLSLKIKSKGNGFRSSSSSKIFASSYAGAFRPSPKTLHFWNATNQSARHYSSDIPDAGFITSKVMFFWKTISESAVVEFSQNSLVSIHAYTGLPWWSIIMLSALSVRLIINLPAAVYQRHLFRRMENINNEMKEKSRGIFLDTRVQASEHRWTEKQSKRAYSQEMSRKYKKLLVANNCHPAKVFLLPLMQIPPWLVISVSFRNLCFMVPYYSDVSKAVHLELSTDGFGWITNLTATDPYYILPVFLLGLNIFLCEVPYYLRNQSDEVKKLKKYIHYFFRTLAVASGVIAAFLPSGVALFWCSTSSLAVAQTCLISSSKFRKIVRMPETKFDPDINLKNLFTQPKIELYVNPKLKKTKIM